MTVHFDRESTNDKPTDQSNLPQEQEKQVQGNGNSLPKSSLKASKYNGIVSPQVQMALDGKNYNSTRYSMNLTLKDGHKGTTGLRAYYIEIITAMQDFCPKLMLLPWNTEKDKDFLKKPDQIPFVSVM